MSAIYRKELRIYFCGMLGWLVAAILLLFAVITVVCNFITDLVYHKFDPRVKEV